MKQWLNRLWALGQGTWYVRLWPNPGFQIMYRPGRAVAWSVAHGFTWRVVEPDGMTRTTHGKRRS